MNLTGKLLISMTSLEDEWFYKSVIYMLKHPNLIEKQLNDCSKTLEGIKSKTSSSEEASLVLRNYLS